jgi:hypothetical protein
MFYIRWAFVIKYFFMCEGTGNSESAETTIRADQTHGLLERHGLPRTCDPGDCRPDGLGEEEFPEDSDGCVPVYYEIQDEDEESD